MSMVGRLGRLPRKIDSRTVSLNNLLETIPVPLPAPPLARNWGRRYLTGGGVGGPIPFSTFGNLQYGDCTCAAIGHYDEAVCTAVATNKTITTDIVFEAYDDISEWDRNQPSKNDLGAQNLDALNWFRKQGLIAAFAAFNEKDLLHVQLGINLFHGVYIGADLPISAKRQVIWDVAPSDRLDPNYAPRSWGGHAMLAVGYDARGVWFVTWGRLQFATWPWFLTYVDEGYVMIHRNLMNSEPSPAGFFVDQISAALSALKTKSQEVRSKQLPLDRTWNADPKIVHLG